MEEQVREIRLQFGDIVQQTKLVWDEKFIRGLHACDVDREQFRSIHSMDLSIGGTALRVWLRENRWRFNWLDGSTKIVNPDYLGFGLAYLSDFEKYNSWEEFSDSFSGPVARGLIYPMTGGQGGCNCFCKKHIHMLFRFRNPDTDLNALTGRDCIKTAFFTTKEEEKALDFTYMTLCPDCRLKTVKFHSNKRFSSQCTNCSETMKRCEKCDRYLLTKASTYRYCRCCVGLSEHYGKHTALI